MAGRSAVIQEATVLLRQTVASVERSVAASEELSSQAVTLRELVSRFQLLRQ